MLDTIVYIPTILAYAFISLLIIILSFIVVYISHRIYVCIYDNLPVAHAALSTIMSLDYKDNAPVRSHSGIVLGSATSLHERKPKTALRIIVTLAPTYLAYVALELEKCNKKNNTNKEQNKFIKYYDRLSQIPMTNPLSTCNSEHQRKIKQRRHCSLSKTECDSNVLGTSTNASIKSVATSTTKLRLFNEENSNLKQEPSVIRVSGSMARPAVTFANAVNALGNIKAATPAEDSQ